MKDSELKFWTTKPSVFLVATTDSGKVVGCISYRQINTDTVEMHRLAVDEDFRKLRIGQRLVQALIDTAKENGYDTMYLETSNAQRNSRRLYERMKFKYFHNIALEWPIVDYLYSLCGLKEMAYIKRI